MRMFERFRLAALTALLAIVIPGFAAAAGMGGGAMSGGGMAGGMTMGGYSNGAMMAGHAGEYGPDAHEKEPGMGNISISGRHVVKLSPARQSLPKIDRNITVTLVPVPEMPDK